MTSETMVIQRYTKTKERCEPLGLQLTSEIGSFVITTKTGKIKRYATMSCVESFVAGYEVAVSEGEADAQSDN